MLDFVQAPEPEPAAPVVDLEAGEEGKDEEEEVGTSGEEGKDEEEEVGTSEEKKEDKTSEEKEEKKNEKEKKEKKAKKDKKEKDVIMKKPASKEKKEKPAAKGKKETAALVPHEAPSSRRDVMKQRKFEQVFKDLPDVVQEYFDAEAHDGGNISFKCCLQFFC